MQEETFELFKVPDPLATTDELTQAVSTLRRFRDSISRTLRAWETFESGDIRLFEITGSAELRERWQGYIDDTRAHVGELRSLQVLLSQKFDTFSNMRDGLVNASALRESSSATRQGEYIKRLTIITVIYLPLSLATAIFSMSMLSGTSTLYWVYWVVVALMTTALTVFTAFDYKEIISVFRRNAIS